ncbi:MAG: response regulator [Chloroflexi bacterium]|nr:response regulator [Chloroflexota bacterium]
MKILVIEDNQDNRDLVSFLLEHAGHEITTAVNGIEGIEAAQVQHPDLILLDLALPEMDGWEVAKKLKTDPTTSDITLVALTAYTMPEDKRRAMDAGCEGYLSKPINAATFPGEVAKFLK